MKVEDKNEFAEILTATLGLYGKDATKGVMSIYWSALVKYPMELVRHSFNSWVQDPKQGTFMPKPADLIRTVQEASGAANWLSANEAWAVALPAFDEAATVVWTDEIAKAWSEAIPVMQTGDKVGARMAFIAAYDRLVAVAQRAGKSAQFFPCIGWDGSLRDQAIERAVTNGLLLAAPARPELMLAAPAAGTGFDQHVTDYYVHRAPSIMERMRQWAADMRKGGELADQERAAQRETARLTFEARKAEVVAQALALDEQYQQAQPKAANGDA